MSNATKQRKTTKATDVLITIRGGRVEFHSDDKQTAELVKELEKAFGFGTVWKGDTTDADGNQRTGFVFYRQM